MCVRNFWKLYKNNDYQPIEFDHDGSVQTKIDNELKAEVISLSNLDEIENEFDFYLQKYGEGRFHIHQELLDRIEKNGLIISKTRSLKERILRVYH